MRKLIVSLVMFAVVCVSATSVFAAAFASVSKSTVTASISFTGAGIVSVSIAGGPIQWSSVTPGVTGWLAANSPITMTSQITNATGGIQIYTDNMAADANPKYPSSIVGQTVPAANPAGLVTASSTTAVLPMCWRLTDGTTTSIGIVQGTDNKLYSTQLGGQAGSYPCFLWMMDKNTFAIPSANTAAFVNGMDYVTIKDAARGGQHAENTFAQFPSPDYIYFGANFSGAVISQAGVNYGATIRLEAFTE
jgi:hypothetical protein